MIDASEIKFLDTEHDRNELLLDIYAIRFHEKKGHWPIVVGQEKYIYFDEWCSITEADSRIDWKYAEVQIENRNATLARVELSKLDWKFGRAFDSLARRGYDYGTICASLLKGLSK